MVRLLVEGLVRRGRQTLTLLLSLCETSNELLLLKGSDQTCRSRRVGWLNVLVLIIGHHPGDDVAVRSVLFEPGISNLIHFVDELLMSFVVGSDSKLLP